MMARPILLAALILSLRPGTASADDPAVSLADLAAYRAALAARADPSLAASVTFRDLWDHPEAHRGRLVRVEGRVARLFRQPAIGAFPPLAEAWITTPVGDPTCLVFPATGGRAVGVPGLVPGDRVRFVGTFLRRITYRGGDTDRVAPLVVGSEAPVGVDPASASGDQGWGTPFGGDHGGDWAIGLAASLGVLWVLLRRHLARPAHHATPIGPPPIFRDGDGYHDDGDGEDDPAFSGADHVAS